MLESALDRAGYLQAFGDSCSCDGGSFSAVFSNEYFEGAGMDDRLPSIELATDDAVRLGLHLKGIAVRVGGVPYRTVKHKADGLGWSVIELQQ